MREEPGSPLQVLLLGGGGGGARGGLERFLTCRVLVPEQCSALCSPLRSSIVLMGRTLVPKRDQVVHLVSAFGPFLARVPPSRPILT